MYSLFIDTHAADVIIVLFKDGIVLDKKNSYGTLKHSEVALPSIKQLLDSNGLTPKNINEIIVVNGPGSFTGERIAVTIAKTLAYTLNISIKTIDALSVIAVNIPNEKNIAIEDKKGAFVGSFDNENNLIGEILYMSNTEYKDYRNTNNVITNSTIDYNKVYQFTRKLKSLNPHEVNPLYIKEISVLNDKKY